MKYKLLAMLLGLSMTGALDAKANEYVGEDYETGQVVVSATRTEQFIEDVPTTMEVITADDIQKMGATTIQQALSMAIGLETTNQKSSINFRGMGFSYASILINGRKPARLESNHDGIGFIVNSIGVNNIERIEIIRGQASAMYGADNLAGLINIITKKSREQGGMFTFNGGNREFITGITYDFGRVGKWDAIVNGSFTESIGIKEKSKSENSTSWSNAGTTYNINLDVGYHLNDDNEFRFIGSYIHDESDSKSDDDDTGVRTEYLSTVRNQYSGAFEYRGKTDNHTFSVTPYATQSTHTAYNKPSATDSVTKENIGGQISKEYFFTDIGLNAQDSWSVNDANLVTYGLEFLHSEISHPSITNDNSIDRVSAYIQDEIFLFDDTVIIVPSLRYDHDSAFGGELIPRLGATWEFVQGHRFKANFGKAYVAPNLVQLYGWETQGSSTAVINGTEYTKSVMVNGNPDLDPETAWGWEVRYEGKYKNLSGSLGYFWAEVDNQISTTDAYAVENDYLQKTRYNVEGKSIRKGIEFHIAYDFAKYFTVTAGYDWLDNKDKDGQRLAYYAPHVYSLGLLFNHPEWGVTANLWGKYNKDFTAYVAGLDSKGSAVASDGSSYIYDYYTVNFAASKTWKDKYTLSAGVYNLFTSNRNVANDGSISPLEFNIGFAVKF